jgi:hypothetical protein
VKRLDPSEFLSAREAYDAAVAETPEVSRFCSASAWNLAARRHLIDGESPPHPETFIWRDEDADTWLLFGGSASHYWQPYESAWLFSCPLIGADPERAVECLREAASRVETAPPKGFVIGGVREGGVLQAALRRMGEQQARGYREYPATDCLTIDLNQGAEAWLSRRSRKFRRSLQSAERRCAAAGLTLENFDGSADETLFERMIALQPRTAKWAAGTDIFQDERYREFYRDLFADLQRQGALRLLIASRDGMDLAYIFGGVFGGEYRGLQMSYAASVADLGVGNRLQAENLRLRAGEGVALYDLGMEADYKLRWADRRCAIRFSFIVF